MESGTRAKLLLLLLWVLCFRYEHADGPNLPGPLLELDNGGTEGDCAEPEMCPKGHNAKAFSVKVEPEQGDAGHNNTALTVVRLHCTLGNADPVVVTSKYGSWGEWSQPQWYPDNRDIEGFALSVECTTADNTTVNNIKIRCSNGKELESSGLTSVSHELWSPSCIFSVCGLETKVQDPTGSDDHTVLSNVRFLCCRG